MATPDPLPRLLAPFVENPARAGILTDFDGTLAPIVDHPGAARPLPGAVELLHDLARHYRRVAVISGRPAAFLVAQLHLADEDEVNEGEAPGEGLVVSGLYGLEVAMGDAITAHPDCDLWRPMVERVADEADEQAPTGVFVERKGLSVTLHYRTAPEAEAWVQRWAASAAGWSGLIEHPARMSVELRPPIPVDKGRVVEELAERLDAACFFGDDVGDLPAYEALDRLHAKGVATLKVVVRSPEAPPELLATADVLVDGPTGALDLLRRMLPGAGRPASPGPIAG
ncbi:MAG TPA: trehalose-phosphatase [Acidimicrobiales bacterium]|nr:trehalose-phosphatase [Acidimicrobiales bacterium]